MQELIVCRPAGLWSAYQTVGAVLVVEQCLCVYRLINVSRNVAETQTPLPPGPQTM